MADDRGFGTLLGLGFGMLIGAAVYFFQDSRRHQRVAENTQRNFMDIMQRPVVVGISSEQMEKLGKDISSALNQKEWKN